MTNKQAIELFKIDLKDNKHMFDRGYDCGYEKGFEAGKHYIVDKMCALLEKGGLQRRAESEEEDEDSN